MDRLQNEGKRGTVSKAPYRADRLELFEFHDAVFELDHMDGETITVYAGGVNINQYAKQNPKEYDLEIRRAHITFRGVSDCTYTPGRTWMLDERGNSVPEGPEIVYRGAEALERIADELRAGIDVFSHSLVDEDGYRIEGMGLEPYFVIRFRARDAVVEWDGYRRPAWYASRQYNEGRLVLDTPEGRTEAMAQCWIDYDPEALFCADSVSDVDPKEISVGIQYKERYYWGRGVDASGQDAFADLKKQLPDGVALRCCLSCRYGNQSPFSNGFDELYCMKDVAVAGKKDLCSCLAGAAAERRSRRYTDLCEDWAAQSDEAYVYSDYPLLLKK